MLVSTLRSSLYCGAYPISLSQNLDKRSAHFRGVLFATAFMIKDGIFPLGSPALYRTICVIALSPGGKIQPGGLYDSEIGVQRES